MIPLNATKPAAIVTAGRIERNERSTTRNRRFVSWGGMEARMTAWQRN
jgi:hypothetical protein